MARPLTRSTENAYLGGVAAGFARYFDVDPVIARLAFVLLAFLHGVGLILYVICWIVMPAAPPEPDGAAQPGPEAAPGPDPAAPESAGPDEAPADRLARGVREAGERVVEGLRSRDHGAGRGQLMAGAILVTIGLLFLLPRLDLWFWPRWLDLWDLWPLILVFIGASMLVRALGGRE